MKLLSGKKRRDYNEKRKKDREWQEKRQRKEQSWIGRDRKLKRTPENRDEKIIRRN